MRHRWERYVWTSRCKNCGLLQKRVHTRDRKTVWLGYFLDGVHIGKYPIKCEEIMKKKKTTKPRQPKTVPPFVRISVVATEAGVSTYGLDKDGRVWVAHSGELGWIPLTTELSSRCAST